MLRGICVLTILGLFVIAPAWAQKPVDKILSKAPTLTAAVAKPAVKPQEEVIAVSPGELKTTPEMWFYEQYMHQYQDPKTAVRANAEFQADQRRRRLASLQWFGFSNSRPHACPDPYHGDYSPGWSSNNSSYPYRWSGVGPTWYVARPERAAVITY